MAATRPSIYPYLSVYDQSVGASQIQPPQLDHKIPCRLHIRLVEPPNIGERD